MSLSNNHKGAISKYPGEYLPDNFNLENLIEELSKHHEGGGKPDYNISEISEYYKIELATSELEREDFFVNITESGFLFISALHNAAIVPSAVSCRMVTSYMLVPLAREIIGNAILI